jgi:hypothetical protein
MTRGRVLSDLACAIADGARVISDFRVMGDQRVAEPLAWMLRPGSAGSNTAADHRILLGEAIAALPPALRRRLMITCEAPHLTSTKPSRRARKETQDPWNPRPPGPTAGPPLYPGPKIQVQKPASPHASGSHQTPVKDQGK